MVPAPADGVALIVGSVAFTAYGPESPDSVRVRLSAVIVKLIAVAFADANPSAAVIDAEIVHVPEDTNATSPDDESTVHTGVVELEYDLVPLLFPALAVEVIVGFVAVSKAYEDVYEPASMVSVREVSAVTLMLMVGETDEL
jgi:hypothetical protein